MSSTETEPTTDEEVTIRRMRRVMALFTGLLVIATWPLWTPGGEFPDIPWFPWASNLFPQQFDWMFLAALGVLLSLQFAKLPANRRWTTLLQAALLGTSLMLLPTDQHRLQPWVWQMSVAAVVIAISSNDRVTLACLRWLTVSIYFWSAISKMDWAFFEGHGQWLLEGLARSLGLSSSMWREETRLLLAGIFPVGELAVAAALMWVRTRRIGLGLAILMHFLLLLTLGPWGQQQLPGVLVWNMYFIVQGLLLFGGRRIVPDLRNDRDSADGKMPQAWMPRFVTGVVCLLPALSPWGYWDHWPSWAVYSSRPAIVQMFVDGADAKRLPETLLPFVEPAEPLTNWHQVNLDAWSFETCWCPMYPQKRFRLAVIASLGADLQTSPQVIIKGTPNRWTGERDVVEIRPAVQGDR